MTDRITVYCDEDLEDLIPEYLENRTEDVRKIRAALAGGGFDEILTIAHPIKGSGASYGFDFISDAGRNIENAAKSGDTGEILLWVDRLSDYLSRVDVVFEE